MKTIAAIVAVIVFILGFIYVLTMESGNSDMMMVKLIAIGFFIVLGIGAFTKGKKDSGDDSGKNGKQS